MNYPMQLGPNREKWITAIEEEKESIEKNMMYNITGKWILNIKDNGKTRWGL